MFNRTLKTLNVGLKECLENTNIWANKACDLIKLKRSILKNKNVDAKFYVLSKAFSDAYYNDELSKDQLYDSSDNSECDKNSDNSDKSDSDLDKNTSKYQTINNTPTSTSCYTSKYKSNKKIYNYYY